MAKKPVQPAQPAEAIVDVPTESTPKALIVPELSFAGDTAPHKFQAVLDSGKPIRAIGHAHVPGTNEWVSYVAHIQDDKVTKFEVGEPNMRLISLDEAKVKFVMNFENGSEESA